MALWPGAAATLSDLATFLGGLSFVGMEDRAEACVNAASRQIEQYLSRRVIYRAPVESLSSIVAQVAITNVGLTIAAQPTAARTLVVDIVDPLRSLTAGTLTIAGTAGGASVMRTVTFSGPGRHHVPDFFTNVGSCIVSGAVGFSASTKIQVGTSLGYVEYHSPKDESLRLIEYPIFALASCYDDTGSPRTYSSTYLLTSGTDFDLSSPSGIVTRLYSGEVYPWSGYRRGAKVTYSAGWTRATVPEETKRAVLKLAGLQWGEQSGRTLGVQSMSNEAGNWTRYAPAEVRGDIAGMLEAYRRIPWNAPTGERIFDEEDC